jgi:hypothetical protein
VSIPALSAGSETVTTVVRERTGSSLNGLRRTGQTNERTENDYQTWVDAKVKDRESKRDPIWSESIAVGSKIFIENVKEKLGISKKGRKVKGVEKID